MNLHALTSSLHPRPARIPVRALIPAALVALLALTSGGGRERIEASIDPALLARWEEPCQSTDGPQYACWLEDQEPTSTP